MERYQLLGPVLLSLVFTIMLVGGAVRSVSNYLDMPVVQRSQETGECVRVEQPKDKHYTCDHLPPKYETVWVL